MMVSFRCLSLHVAVVCLTVPVFLSTNSGFVHSSDEAVEVSIDERDCRRAVRHVARGDVAYKPGVDVRGNPVVPADLAGTTAYKGPEKITISLSFDLLESFGIDTGVGVLIPEVNAGTVTYDIGSGRLEIDGKPLLDEEVAALVAACASLDSN